MGLFYSILLQRMPPENPNQDLWFKENLLPHEEKLRAWLISRFPSTCDIDDVIQDAYVRVLKAHDKGTIRSPKAFLFATARNLATDRLRRIKVANNEILVENEVSSVWDEKMGIPETISKNQELEMLTKAIQSLPTRCRQIFTLRKVYGMSQKAIAKKMGISENTVSNQLTIGLHKCRDYMRTHMGRGEFNR